MSDKKETMSLSSGEKMEIDPALLVESFDDMSKLVTANVAILEAVRDITIRGVKLGMDRDKAGAVALELHRRASAKANGLVHINEEEMKELEKTEVESEAEANPEAENSGSNA